MARSREKLLRAASDLLIEDGLDAVTVDAVARCSGVSKSTMYRHFPSRDQLLVEAIRRNMPDVPDDLPSSGFDDQVRTFLRSVAAAMADPDWLRVLPSLMVLRGQLSDVDVLADRARATLVEQVRNLVSRGEQEGLLPAGSDAVATLNMLIGPLVVAMLEHDTHRLADLADEVGERYIASCRYMSADR